MGNTSTVGAKTVEYFYDTCSVDRPTDAQIETLRDLSEYASVMNPTAIDTSEIAIIRAIVGVWGHKAFKMSEPLKRGSLSKRKQIPSGG